MLKKGAMVSATRLTDPSDAAGGAVTYTIRPMTEQQTPHKSNLEGAVPPLASQAERNAAMDQAFDYRGDITLHTADGRVIEGYIFDRRSHLPEPYIRLIPKDSNDRVTILYKDITRLVFS